MKIANAPVSYGVFELTIGRLVIEQDRILEPGERVDDAGAAQRRNRRWLAEHAGI